MPEETPEQIMARLARYADSLRRSPGAPIDDASRREISRAAGTGTLPPRSSLQSLARRGPVPTVAPAAPPAPAYPWPLTDPPSAPVAVFAPATPAAPAASRFVFSPPLLRDVRVTVFGQLLAVAGCAGAVLAFILFGTTLASVLVLAVLAVGVTAIAGHRSLAWWWTLGVLAGGLLGRFS